jgi:molecular chaperone GrpE
VDVQPVDVQPVDVQPVDVQPVDVTPVDVQPATPDRAVSDQAVSDRAESDQAAPAAQVAALAAELEECQARHLRTLADFDNVRRRAGREAERARAAERDQVIRDWLPVLDNLDLALDHTGADPKALVEGIGRVRELALAALRRSGVTRVDEAAVPFDPVRHEVAAVVEPSPSTGPDPARRPGGHGGGGAGGTGAGAERRTTHPGHGPPPPGTVLGVFRPGYLIDGRVLRPASVAVSAGGPSHGDQRN